MIRHVKLLQIFIISYSWQYIHTFRSNVSAGPVLRRNLPHLRYRGAVLRGQGPGGQDRSHGLHFSQVLAVHYCGSKFLTETQFEVEKNLAMPYYAMETHYTCYKILCIRIIIFCDFSFFRLTKCTFHKFGSSGELEKHDALCILPLNIFNEKIYIFLWFWMLGLVGLTSIVVLYRLPPQCSIKFHKVKRHP